LSPDPEETGPATRRLEAYLKSLGDDPPRPGAELAPAIVRRARWQRIVRVPLHAAGSLVGALADGLAVFFGSGRGRQS
jgi:hypothetical protein